VNAFVANLVNAWDASHTVLLVVGIVAVILFWCVLKNSPDTHW
jgi:hypothetical protein